MGGINRHLTLDYLNFQHPTLLLPGTEMDGESWDTQESLSIPSSASYKALEEQLMALSHVKWWQQSYELLSIPPVMEEPVKAEPGCQRGVSLTLNGWWNYVLADGRDSQPSGMGWFSWRAPWMGADIHQQLSWCFCEQVNQNSAQKCSFCSSYWYFSLDKLLALELGVWGLGSHRT